MRCAAVTFITCLCILSVTGLISFGMASAGGMMGLAALGVLTGAIYGRFAGLLAVGLSLVLLAAVAFGVHVGVLPIFTGSIGEYTQSATAWISAGVNLLLIAVVLVLGISAIQERLRLAAESARSESELTDMALNAQHDIFFVFNVETKKVIRWNVAFRRLVGLSDKEIATRPMPDAWADVVDIAEAEAAMKRLSEGSTRCWETELHTKDGRVVPIEFRGVLMERRGGSLIIGVGRDLTDRYRTSQALRESEERFRLITHNVAAAVWTAKDPGEPTYISPNIEKICGLSAAEIMDGGARLWTSRVHEEDRPFLDQSILRLFQQMRSVDLQYRFETKDRGPIWIHHHAAPVQGKDGRVTACGVWTDITEQVQASQDLHQTEKMQALGRLAGGVAHDFNNQIAAISGCAEMLAKKAAPYPHLREYIRHIRTSAELASSLTEQLLTFSRKTQDRQRPQDAHSLIHQTVSMLKRSLSRNIRIVERLDAEHAIVSADASRLQNAVLNLCLNAQDAMPNGGALFVSTRIVAADTEKPRCLHLLPGRYLCIEVKDTGHGMNEATRARVFEPFFTTKPEGKGCGLGLSGVLNFVRSSRGSVDVTSTVDLGTTFSLYLPIWADTACSTAGSPGHDLGRRNILIIDDDTEVSKITAEILEEFGYDVDRCSSGRIAVDRYREDPTKIDLVILDWVMPDLSGAETFSALRRVNENIKILLASARVKKDEVETFLDRGLVGYIEKPFSAEELARKIDAALDAG